MSIAAVLASIVLIAVLGARHVERRGAAIVTSALFATMPVTWLAAKGDAAQIVLVPATLVWLLSLDGFLRTSSRGWLVAAGASLGVMPYLHLAGAVLAPAYFAVGVLALVSQRDRVTAIASLAAGLLIAVPGLFLMSRDGALANAINHYGLYDANRFNPLQGAREIGSWVGLTVRSEVYWDCLNPALLFLGKGGWIATLTGSSVFWLPLAVPLVRGVILYINDSRGPMDWVVLGTLLASPLAAALIAQPPAPRRLIVLAPLVAIVAARGCYPGARRTSVAGSPLMAATVASTR